MDIQTNAMTVYICDDNWEQMNTLRQTLEGISDRIVIEAFVSSSDLLLRIEELQIRGENMLSPNL